MSWIKYTVERKEVSYDRGLTWSDTGEYCEGTSVGVYSTLDACEDIDCELEEYRYTVVAMRPEDFGKMCTNTNIGGTQVQKYHFPSGIIKHVLFSDPTPHGSGYYTAHNFYYRAYNEMDNSMSKVNIGVWNDTLGMRSFDSGATIDGKEVQFEGDGGCYCGADVAWHCWALDYCFTIDEFCDWVGETVNVIYKSHWTRQHCSDEWVYDEEYGTNFYTIGERWISVYDYAAIDYKWVHQEAVVDSGGSITWIDVQDEPIYQHRFVIPQGAVGLEYVDSSYGVFPINVSRYSMAGSVKQVTVEASLKDVSTYGNAFVGFSAYNNNSSKYEGYYMYASAGTQTCGFLGGARFIPSSPASVGVYISDVCFHGSPSNRQTATVIPSKQNSVLTIFGISRNEAVGGYNVTYYYCRIMKANDNTNYRLHRLWYVLKTSSSDTMECFAVPVLYNGGVYLLDPIRRILIKPVQNGLYNETEINSWYISY